MHSVIFVGNALFTLVKLHMRRV